MATGKITKRAVDAVAPAMVDQFLWDEELRGFGFKVTAKGARSYLLQYRMGGRGTPTRRYTIGKHGSPWTPSTARVEADRLLALVKTGIDPQAADRERQRIAVDLAFGAYLERFLRDYGQKAWRKSTFNGAASYLRRYVAPVIGKKPLPEIKRTDIVSIFDNLPSGHPALPRNVFDHTRKLFNWARERGDIDRSPFDGFKGPPNVPSRDRVLSDHELKLIWKASTGLGRTFGPMIRLLMVTGQRREEVAGLDWKELHRPASEWVIPAARSKNGKAHTVPLSEIAITQLDALAGGKEWPEKGLVFTTTGSTPASGHSRAKQRLDRLMSELLHGTDLEPWRVHDLRRTVATGLQRLGVRFEVTEAVLNHVSGSKSGVAGVYQRHNWKEEKREALSAWAAHVWKLVSE